MRAWSGLVAGVVLGGCTQVIGADWGAYQCASASDCPAPSECYDAACMSGVCGATASSAHSACASGVCDGSGSCVACLDGSDCGSGACADEVCACGAAGAEASPPSCTGAVGADNHCGAAGDKICCENKLVPCGTYLRSYDGVTLTVASAPATVSDFRLDTYEITVGRFRAFVGAGYGTQAKPPASNAGAHPAIAGSGWDSGWNGELRTDAASLSSALVSCGSYSTWTAAAGANERRPISCITWYEAFAFCVWDGGRLPTEAEWNYAAAGGSEQRVYPWGSTIDHDHAVYDCGGGTCNDSSDIGLVGSKPLGDGRWGQADMAGNVWEWTLDRYAGYITRCNDCANSVGGANRVRRGGSFSSVASNLLAGHRDSVDPTNRGYSVGARCARSP